MRVRDDGSIGKANDVSCGGIENKMGMKGSATCLLNYGEKGECTGELLGKEKEGIRVMFHMMNEQRLLVGLQGLAQGSTAYLHALNYAKERLQGVPPGEKGLRASRHHPAPRRPEKHCYHEGPDGRHAGADLIYNVLS